MKNKLILGIISIMCLIGIKEVNAATSAFQGQTGYEALESSYNSFKNNIPKVTASTNNQTVTLFGKSICSSSEKSCDYNYAGFSMSSDVEDVITTLVKCSNNEKYIVYRFLATGKGSYIDDNKANYDSGTDENPVYWSEDYVIYCTNNNSNVDGEVIENNSSSNSTGNNSGSDYNSSTTVPPEATGVETYYIILGVVGLITYGIMSVVKKYNMFKKM